ncbi:hypothetical protein J6590_048335 [Homalodisca vitripennis]|nr:hypothetical protein J6590_048335 [Homalodisca vitripennis]
MKTRVAASAHAVPCHDPPQPAIGNVFLLVSRSFESSFTSPLPPTDRQFVSPPPRLVASARPPTTGPENIASTYLSQ